ncbi:MAG: hypothetical protein H6507_10930 [Calditrichaeota bacterium]|nr:hypothetical protein [Calditrichota bacterium]
MASKPTGTRQLQNSKTDIRIQGQAFPNDYRDAMSIFIRSFVTTVLRSTNGNISQAARQMNIARRNLQLKVKALEIDVDALRNGEQQSDIVL